MNLISKIIIVTIFLVVGIFSFNAAPISALAFGDSSDGGCCGGGYSQPSYYSQSSYAPAYSQPSYYSQSSYAPAYSQPSYYSQSSYYSQPSYYSQSSYYSQPSYYSQSSYAPAYSEGSYYSQGSYAPAYSEGSYYAEAAYVVNKPASCDLLTVSPDTLPHGGGTVTITWETTNATSVSISPDIGAVSADGTKTGTVTGPMTFTLTAVGTGGNDDCTASVTVEPPTPVASCDLFEGSPTLVPVGGGDVTLTWKTTNATAVSINNGIGSVALNGSKTVRVDSDITYTLTAQGTGGNDDCSVPLTVKTTSYSQGSYSSYSQGSYSSYSQGSYGGGSSNPRCDLDISKEEIDRGESVKLTWNTSRATEVILKDDRGNILMTTEDLSSSDKKDFYDGEITVRPIRDTKYTLTAEKGSKDDDCRVEVEVNDSVTILETRNQEPRIAGISLTQVPYTGFEAGPTLTFIFYALLTLWALFVAYVLVIKQDSIAGFSLAGAFNKSAYKDMSVDDTSSEHISPAETYVQATTTQDTPANLPTMDAAAIGYASYNDTMVTEEDEALNALENHAHEKRVLLSSDAMRHFTHTVSDTQSQLSVLDEVIAHAKASFPSEDGWIVLNLSRMERVLQDIHAPVSDVQLSQMVAPVTAGSLAEAIVTGNIIAAYQMIESRPMVALADASADLDAVYRSRKGETVAISEVLRTHTTPLATQQIQAAIAALTSALDGTYTDEASAVKMAIMKAVKAVS